MAGVRERLGWLYSLRVEHRHILRANRNDPKKDVRGVCSSALSIDLEFFAIADFVLHGDMPKFREQMSESAALHHEMFARFDRGDPIDESYVTPLSYKSVFIALAAGDFLTADKLASRIMKMPVTRDIHIFDDRMGRALSALCVSHADAPHHIANLEKACAKHAINFAGYPLAFLAVLDRDLDTVNGALKTIVDGHKKESANGGVFEDTEDEVLCVWGLGVANLARYVGVPVSSPDEELIPSRLLV